MRSLKQLMALDGRVFIVTGGGGYLGGAMSEALVESGATVILADLDEQRCGYNASKLNQHSNGKAISKHVDLSDENSTRMLVKHCLSECGHLEGLIHCAGFVGTTEYPGWAVPFREQSLEAWDKAIRVNLSSAFVLTQEAASALSVSGHGSVIFVLSTYGLVGPDMRLYQGIKMQNPVAYGASKGGLLQLMRYFSTLLAPQTRVNAISPGGVWRNQPESFQKRYQERTPLRRMAQEEDLKGATIYLASDLAAYVTGHNLVVDGGWTAW